MRKNRFISFKRLYIFSEHIFQKPTTVTQTRGAVLRRRVQTLENREYNTVYLNVVSVKKTFNSSVHESTEKDDTYCTFHYTVAKIVPIRKNQNTTSDRKHYFFHESYRYGYRRSSGGFSITKHGSSLQRSKIDTRHAYISLFRLWKMLTFFREKIRKSPAFGVRNQTRFFPQTHKMYRRDVSKRITRKICFAGSASAKKNKREQNEQEYEIMKAMRIFS